MLSVDKGHVSYQIQDPIAAEKKHQPQVKNRSAAKRYEAYIISGFSPVAPLIVVPRHKLHER